MRLNASNSVLLGALFVLAMLSVGLKAAAGPADDGNAVPATAIADRMIEKLKAQGFATRTILGEQNAPIVLAERGDCRVSARDARTGVALAPMYAREAGGVGAVRYFYRGETFDAPPQSRMWIDHFQNKLYGRLQIQRSIAVPIALAASPGCNGEAFGLGDFRITV